MFLDWKNYNHCMLSEKKQISLRTDSYFQLLQIWSAYLPYDQQIRPSRKVM